MEFGREQIIYIKTPRLRIGRKCRKHCAKRSMANKILPACVSSQSHHIGMDPSCLIHFVRLINSKITYRLRICTGSIGSYFGSNSANETRGLNKMGPILNIHTRKGNLLFDPLCAFDPLLLYLRQWPFLSGPKGRIRTKTRKQTKAIKRRRKTQETLSKTISPPG